MAPIPEPAPTVLAQPNATAGANAPSTRFDIIVASFRTDARATAVTMEVAALGLPTRRRVSDGWQQVLSGPFDSRAAAEQAQERLRAAGFGGTQIVPPPAR